jgi:hypothetical protein
MLSSGIQDNTRKKISRCTDTGVQAAAAAGKDHQLGEITGKLQSCIIQTNELNETAQKDLIAQIDKQLTVGQVDLPLRLCKWENCAYNKDYDCEKEDSTRKEELKREQADRKDELARQEAKRKQDACARIVDSFTCDPAGHYHISTAGTYTIKIEQIDTSVAHGPRSGTRLSRFSLHVNPPGTRVADLMGSPGSSQSLLSDGNKDLFLCSTELGTLGGCEGSSCAATGHGAKLVTSGGASTTITMTCE